MGLRGFSIAALTLLAMTTVADGRPRAKPQAQKKARPANKRPPIKRPPIKPQPAAPTEPPAPEPSPPEAPEPVLAPPVPTASAPASEPHQTTEDVVLHRAPGEHSPEVGRLAKGTVVKIERVTGRWYRVRAGGVVGYLTRTTVSGGEVIPEDTRGAWSSQRGADAASTGLVVRVTAESSPLFAEPHERAAVVVAAARGAELDVLEAPHTAGWLHARDDQGHAGWIRTAHVADTSASVALSGLSAPVTSPSSMTSIVERAPARTRSRFSVRADAGIGLRLVGMDFTSNGTAGLANYVVSADASAATFDLDVVARPAGRLFVGVDGRVQLSRSSPGIDYVGPSGPPRTIAFSTFGSDVGIRAGITTKKFFEIALRGGGHYDAFLARDVETVGLLPRERLLGGTLGVRVDLAPPRSRIGVTGRFDALVVGTRAQTPGLEDGASSTARALWGGVTMRIWLARHLALHGAYDFGRATTRWTGMSVRDPDVTEARRVDTTQLVQIGLSTTL